MIDTEYDDEPVADDAVVDALRRIGKNDGDGIIQPEVIVSIAVNPDSPLHRYFTWDDTEAARQFRLAQARNLVRRVLITRTPTPEPSFVNVTIQRTDGTIRRGYVETKRAVVEPDLYVQIVADARRGLIAYRNRLSAFDQAHELVAGLDRLIEDTTPPAEPNNGETES